MIHMDQLYWSSYWRSVFLLIWDYAYGKGLRAKILFSLFLLDHEMELD